MHGRQGLRVLRQAAQHKGEQLGIGDSFGLQGILGIQTQQRQQAAAQQLQTLGFVVDVGGGFLLQFGVAGHGAHQVGVAQHGGHGGLDLVRKGGDKILLPLHGIVHGGNFVLDRLCHGVKACA